MTLFAGKWIYADDDFAWAGGAVGEYRFKAVASPDLVGWSNGILKVEDDRVAGQRRDFRHGPRIGGGDIKHRTAR